MAKRNSNGQGSIIQRKTGLWMGAITLEDQRKFIYGKSSEEVKEKLDYLKNSSKEITDKLSRYMLLGDWLDIWLDLYKKTTVKPSTYISYEGIIKNHLKPSLGKVFLGDLSDIQIQRLYKIRARNLPSIYKG